MIKKIVGIEKGQSADDTVLLSWFDMKKPNLSAVTKKGVEFILKIKDFDEGDTFIAEDGYRIKVEIKKEELFVFKFQNALDFAKAAYEIGNRHQPICIDKLIITVLNDSSLHDIVHALSHNKSVSVQKISGVFRQNAIIRHAH
ncbi:MAG: urease accessory protein UreE [Campylobacteraceae bacterium]|jgi:urease accessory protein|nr:urease accessory protein UreE [Campylobacteraceae bacterium]